MSALKTLFTTFPVIVLSWIRTTHYRLQVKHSDCSTVYAIESEITLMHWFMRLYYGLGYGRVSRVPARFGVAVCRL